MKNFRNKLLLPALALPLLVGCGKKPVAENQLDGSALQQTFSVAAPASGIEAVKAALDQPQPAGAAAPDSLHTAISEVLTKIRAKKLPEAQTHLQTILMRTNLNAAQYTAIQDTMAQIQGELARRAAMGDAEARRALEEFQNSVAK